MRIFTKIFLILCFLLPCISAPAARVRSELTGQKILTTDPFGLLPENKFQAFIVEQIPQHVSARSKIVWLRDTDSFKLIQSILKLNVPLVTGEIPQGTTADAFVLPNSYQMTLDVLAAKKDQIHQSILFIQSTATEDVISHELQHWQDNESGLVPEFLKRLDAFQKKAKLTESEFVKIQDAVVEIRGHARQEMVLMSHTKTNNPESLHFVANLYMHYAENLIPILIRLEKKSPSQYRELLQLLADYELPTKGELRFTKLFADRYKN